MMLAEEGSCWTVDASSKPVKIIFNDNVCFNWQNMTSMMKDAQSNIWHLAQAGTLQLHNTWYRGKHLHINYLQRHSSGLVVRLIYTWQLPTSHHCLFQILHVAVFINVHYIQLCLLPTAILFTDENMEYLTALHAKTHSTVDKTLKTKELPLSIDQWDTECMQYHREMPTGRVDILLDILHCVSKKIPPLNSV